MQAVLFDFDGTLADTMTGHFFAWNKALSIHDVKISRGDYFPLEGMGMYELAKNFTSHINLPADKLKKLVEEKKRIYKEENKHIKFYDGVPGFIDILLNKNIKIGIVTASHFDQLSETVDQNFLSLFDAVVTGDRVSKNKPDPDPYLEGAKTVGVTPDDCIVVENAPLGIKAAKQAGMYCVAITSTLAAVDLIRADEIVKNFAALKHSEGFNRLLKEL